MLKSGKAIKVITTEKMHKYTIQKGNHRSGIFFAPKFYHDNLSFDFMLEEACYFKPVEEDDFDINKLYGLSFGMHHTNSIRLGWCPSKQEGKIELYAYWYNDKKRDFKYMTTVDVGVVYNCKIALYDNTFMMIISDSYGVKLSEIAISYKYPEYKFGYYLFPYFGGNKTAPHKMSIWVGRKREEAMRIPMMFA